MPCSMSHQADPAGRTLLDELNHRIKNELASIINLVSFNAVWTDNSDAKAELSNVVDLLHHHAAVHTLLTRPETEAFVDAGEAVRKLGIAMSRSKLDRMKIRLLLAVGSFPLEAERCWRLGLAVYELLTNCARHACFDSRAGEIKLELVRAGSWVKCRVTDNGSGAGRINPGRGLRIVGDLVNSLGGRIERASGPMWNSFALAFPLSKPEHRAARRPRTARQSKNASPRVALAATKASSPALELQV
jgi:two-component sensor histidine kinase